MDATGDRRNRLPVPPHRLEGQQLDEVRAGCEVRLVGLDDDGARRAIVSENRIADLAAGNCEGARVRPEDASNMKGGLNVRFAGSP
jgi:hypothetical protein